MHGRGLFDYFATHITIGHHRSPQIATIKNSIRTMSLLRNGCSAFGSALRVVVTRGVANKSFNRVVLARPFSASAGGEDSHKRTSKDDDALAEGEILLYKGSQLKPILLMLSVSAVNVMVRKFRGV